MIDTQESPLTESMREAAEAESLRTQLAELQAAYDKLDEDTTIINGACDELIVREAQLQEQVRKLQQERDDLITQLADTERRRAKLDRLASEQTPQPAPFLTR